MLLPIFDMRQQYPEGVANVGAIRNKDSGDAYRASQSESAPNGDRLTEYQQKQVERLKQIDARVRAHESAHAAAAGGLARGSSLNMTTGPDGKTYAVGGEVKIDISQVSGNPSATITKMQTVSRAALAPADPSGQDRAVAAAAASIETRASAELAEKQTARTTNTPAKHQARSSLLSNTYLKQDALGNSTFSISL